MSETSLKGEGGEGVVGRAGARRIGVGIEGMTEAAQGKEVETGEEADESDETDEDSDGVSARRDDVDDLCEPMSALFRHRDPFREPEDPTELTESPSRARLLATARSRASFACRSFSRLTSSRSTRL